MRNIGPSPVQNCVIFECVVYDTGMASWNFGAISLVIYQERGIFLKIWLCKIPIVCMTLKKRPFGNRTPKNYSPCDFRAWARKIIFSARKSLKKWIEFCFSRDIVQKTSLKKSPKVAQKRKKVATKIIFLTPWPTHPKLPQKVKKSPQKLLKKVDPPESRERDFCWVFFFYNS